MAYQESQRAYKCLSPGRILFSLWFGTSTLDFFFKSYYGDKIPIPYSELFGVVCMPETFPHLVSWLWGCLAHSDCACLTRKSGSLTWNYLLPLTPTSHPRTGCCLFGLPSEEKQNSLPVYISKVTSVFRYRMFYQTMSYNKIFLKEYNNIFCHYQSCC